MTTLPARPFTVVGVFEEPFGQRYAETFLATGPREAEEMAPAGLVVAAVLAGDVSLVDTYTDGRSNAPATGSREPVMALSTSA